MKKHLLIIISILLLFGCSYRIPGNSSTHCEECVIKVGENKDFVESRLGPAIRFKTNKDGTYTAVYTSAYDSSNANRAFSGQHPTNRTSSNNKSLINTVTTNKLIVMYDSNLKVKHYHFTKENH